MSLLLATETPVRVRQLRFTVHNSRPASAPLLALVIARRRADLHPISTYTIPLAWALVHPLDHQPDMLAV